MKISPETTSLNDPYKINATARSPAPDLAASEQPLASSVVSLSIQGRQQWAEEMQQVLASQPDMAASQAQTQARLRKMMEKLLKRTALLEMDVFSELREKVKAQLQQKTPLPPAQRQANDDSQLQRQQDAKPSTPD